MAGRASPTRGRRDPSPLLARLGRRSTAVGAAGTAAALAGAALDGEQFFRSYLVGWLAWLSVGLGCLAILLIDHLAGGRWGIVARVCLAEWHTETTSLMKPDAAR